MSRKYSEPSHNGSVTRLVLRSDQPPPIGVGQGSRALQTGLAESFPSDVDGTVAPRDRFEEGRQLHRRGQTKTFAQGSVGLDSPHLKRRAGGGQSSDFTGGTNAILCPLRRRQPAAQSAGGRQTKPSRVRLAASAKLMLAGCFMLTSHLMDSDRPLPRDRNAVQPL